MPRILFVEIICLQFIYIQLGKISLFSAWEERKEQLYFTLQLQGFQDVDIDIKIKILNPKS